MSFLIISLCLFRIMFNVFEQIEIYPIKKKGTGIHANSITLYNCMAYTATLIQNRFKIKLKRKRRKSLYCACTKISVVKNNVQDNHNNHTIAPHISTSASGHFLTSSVVQQMIIGDSDWFDAFEIKVQRHDKNNASLALWLLSAILSVVYQNHQKDDPNLAPVSDCWYAKTNTKYRVCWGY